jgi:hypothetical protein
MKTTIKGHTLAEQVYNAARSVKHWWLSIDSTCGKPSDAEKQAIEACVNEGFEAPMHVHPHHAHDVIDRYVGDEAASMPLDDLVRTTLADAMMDYAIEHLVDDWGGDVTDGASFIVTLD